MTAPDTRIQPTDELLANVIKTCNINIASYQATRDHAEQEQTRRLQERNALEAGPPHAPT